MSKLLYDGFHKIEAVNAVVKGVEVLRERLIVRDAVGAILIDENDKIGLVVQYRPTARFTSKEIPAGLMDKEGLSHLEVMMEEIAEECEIPKEEILKINEKPIHTYFMMAGSSDAIMRIYLMRVEAQVNKKVDDVDVEEVIWVSESEMGEMINNGEIKDSKTIISYYYIKEYLKNIKKRKSKRVYGKRKRTKAKRSKLKSKKGKHLQ